MSFPLRRVDFAILRYAGDGARPDRYLLESVLGYEVTCSYVVLLRPELSMVLDHQPVKTTPTD